jgi:hypothetical protein
MVATLCRRQFWQNTFVPQANTFVPQANTFVPQAILANLRWRWQKCQRYREILCLQRGIR